MVGISPPEIADPTQAPEVGTGTFWRGIADLVAGVKRITEVVLEIDTDPSSIMRTS